MEYEQITVEQRNDVVVITLSRPERLNAWTPRMSVEMTDVIEAADEDPTVGALVVTGEGRGFCAGADIEAIFQARIDGDERADQANRPRRDWVELIRTTKPIVAAVNGPSIGVGLTMILPFDRIVASTAAKLSLRFVKMGLVPELASSHFVPQRVGFGAASDLMLSGRTVDAAEALGLGLVDEVVEPDELLPAAIARARSYGENPAPQLRWIKELISANASETDIGQVQRRELSRLQEAYASAEHREAVSAFLEKRPPVFR